VSGCPLIKIELESEDVARDKLRKLNTLLKKLLDILYEEERRNIVVLVLHYVSDHRGDSAHLVVLQSVVDG
jgi:hypothetical protein